MEPDIIYEDKYLIAIHKPAGVATQTSRVTSPDIVSITSGYLSGSGKSSVANDSVPFIGLINRLDQPVEGIVLMARDKRSASLLSEQLRNNEIEKHYLAGIVGSKPEQGHLTGNILFDKRTNTSSMVPDNTPGSKPAALEYHMIKTIKPQNCSPSEDTVISLADIHLITGRHHQIRVQMSDAGLPLLGDRKYAPEYVRNVNDLLKISEICLCACSLTFTHPVNNDKISLRVKPQCRWYRLFN